MKVNVFGSVAELERALADNIVATARKSITARGVFNFVLSGGNSPKSLNKLLAGPEYRNQIEWPKINFFFGDERYVPADDPQSNALMARQTLFEPLKISESQIFAINTALAPEESAKDYADRIGDYFKDRAAQFDLILLGLGDNSHTASLFPHTPVLHEKTASVKAVWLEGQKVHRITMTAPMINAARHIAFLVYGAGKAEAVHHVQKDQTNIEEYPAQLIRPANGEVQWYLDRPAAAKL